MRGDFGDQAACSRMESQGQALMAAHLDNGSLLRNYTHVLTVIMRLRQVSYRVHSAGFRVGH